MTMLRHVSALGKTNSFECSERLSYFVRQAPACVVIWRTLAGGGCITSSTSSDLAADLLGTPPHAQRTSIRALWLSAFAISAAGWAHSYSQQRQLRGNQKILCSQHSTASRYRAPDRFECKRAPHLSNGLPSKSTLFATALTAAHSAAVRRDMRLTPAVCQEVLKFAGQQQEQLQRLQQQQLVLFRAFDMMRPAVVRIYAVFPVSPRGPAAKRSKEAAQVGLQGHEEQQHFRFLGSGFFFDERGESTWHFKSAPTWPVSSSW